MLTAQTIKNQHSDIFTFLHGDLEIGGQPLPRSGRGRAAKLGLRQRCCATGARRGCHKPAILIVPAKMTGRARCSSRTRDSCCFSVQEHLDGHGDSC